MKITKGVSNNYEIVEKHVVQEDDEKTIQNFVQKYCQNFHVDFNNDISITVKLKSNPKLDAQVMSIKLKEQYCELIDPEQESLFDFPASDYSEKVSELNEKIHKL